MWHHYTQMKTSKGHSQEKKVITGNELCRYILGFPAKQEAAQLIELHIRPERCAVLELGVYAIGPRYLGETQVGFNERDDDGNSV